MTCSPSPLGKPTYGGIGTSAADLHHYLNLTAFCLRPRGLEARISPIVGYLLAGILIGPHTPGFTADMKIAEELSEIGVVLLMFGVGLHFSVEDFMEVRKIALVGAIGRILVDDADGHGACVVLGLAALGRHPVRPCALGCQYRRAAARLRRAQHSQKHGRPHRHRLVDRRRPCDDLGPRPNPRAGRNQSRHAHPSTC